MGQPKRKLEPEYIAAVKEVVENIKTTGSFSTVKRVKQWCIFEQLITDIIDSAEMPSSDPTPFYNSLTRALDILSKYDDPRKFLPQPPLFKDFCERVLFYLKHSSVKSSLIYLYARKIENRKRREDREHWEIEERHKLDQLLHNGKMNAYLATDSGSIEIENLLRESNQPTAPTFTFVLSLDEIKPITELDLVNLKYKPKNMFSDDRLALSSIGISLFEEPDFFPNQLSDNNEALIKKFNRIKK